MRKLMCSKTCSMSAELLNRFYALPVLDQDRAKYIKSAHGRRHLESLRKFIRICPLPFEWATVQVGDVVYRLNGSHSSTILKEWLSADEDISSYQVHLQEWQADSVSEAGLILAQFDNRVSARTSQQVTNSLWETNEEAKRLYNKRSWKMATAAYILNEFGDYGNMSDLEKADALINHKALSFAVQWFNDNPWKDQFQRDNFGRPVLAMGFRTLNEANDDKEWRSFWDGLLRYQGHPPTDPRYQVGSKICGGGMRAKNTVERRQFMREIYTAWRTWRNGGKYRIKKGKKLPCNYDPWSRCED